MLIVIQITCTRYYFSILTIVWSLDFHISIYLYPTIFCYFSIKRHVHITEIRMSFGDQNWPLDYEYERIHHWTMRHPNVTVFTTDSGVCTPFYWLNTVHNMAQLAQFSVIRTPHVRWFVLFILLSNDWAQTVQIREFSDQFSVHFSSVSQNVLISNLKFVFTGDNDPP